MWQFCICQEAFLKGELDLIQELVSKYELDGVWLDGGGSPACYCDECQRQLRKKGLDPLNTGVQYDHKEQLRQSFLERIYQVIKKTRPGCLACPQNQGPSSVSPSAHRMSIIPPRRRSSRMQSIMATTISRR